MVVVESEKWTAACVWKGQKSSVCRPYGTSRDIGNFTLRTGNQRNKEEQKLHARKHLWKDTDRSHWNITSQEVHRGTVSIGFAEYYSASVCFRFALTFSHKQLALATFFYHQCKDLFYFHFLQSSQSPCQLLPPSPFWSSVPPARLVAMS